MQMATMTTFPGPCRNVVLLPDRGFVQQKYINSQQGASGQQLKTMYL